MKELKSITKLLEKHWNSYDSQNPINIQFLDENLEALYDQDKSIRKIILFFTSIGILISILGLIGMTGYTIEQKTKEIGIRKALGASFSSIITMLSKNFTIWILISFILATPISYFFMNKWLEGFAYRIKLEWWIFILGGIFALIIALFTISLQTSKAAKINPADSLRYE